MEYLYFKNQEQFEEYQKKPVENPPKKPSVTAYVRIGSARKGYEC